MKGRSGVGAGGRGMRGVMGAESVLDDPPAHQVNGWDAAFGIDQEVLPAERASDLGGEFCWLTYVH